MEPFATPTGRPCPRSVREDGTVEGSGDCGSCGCCLLLAEAAWPDDYGVTTTLSAPVEAASPNVS